MRLVGVGEVWSNVSGIERTGENLTYLLDDGHIDVFTLGQSQNRCHRCKPFSGLLHLLDDIGEAVALTQ